MIPAGPCHLPILSVKSIGAGDTKTSYDPKYAPRLKPLPPRHLPKSQLANNSPRRLRRDLEHLHDHAGRDERSGHDKLDQLLQL